MPPLVATSLILSPMIYLTGHWKISAVRNIALAAMGVIWVFFFAIARDFTTLNTGAVTYTQGMISFYFNGLSLLFTAIVFLLSTLVIIYSGPDIKGQEGEEKYYAMVLLMTGAVVGMVSAGDLFNLWMWFEITAISSYLLVAFYRDSRVALAACAKYLIQTAAGSIVVLFGIALVFAQTGTLDLAQIQLPATPLMIVVGALFVMGFGVKIALAPNYTWLPDAYAEAPTGISALLSGIVTISGLAALLRVLALLKGLTLDWGAVLIAFGTLNIVIGNLLALRQSEVKRIFAYSSVSHIGFIVLAVGIGLYTHQINGFQSGMLHLFNHGIMKALAFLGAGAVIYTRLNPDTSLHVNDLNGLSKRDPLTTFGLVIACLSLAGIPPLAGFMSKWQIFTAGLAADNGVVTLLTVFAALNSVFSLAYYFPIINAMFRAESSPPVRKIPVAMHIPIVLLTAAVLLLGIYPALLDGLIVPASKSLMTLFGG